MIRLRSLAGCAIACTCMGCSGQDLEGTWLGALPIDDASACRIKIYSDHRFDVSCGKLEWVGAGKYDRVGDKLSFTFAPMVRRGQVIRDFPPIRLEFRGEGNRLRLGPVGGHEKPIVWERARL